MQTELTPTIAEMSEVVSNYMGHSCRIIKGNLFIIGKPNSSIRGGSLFHFSWDWLHEVWEKVRGEEKWTIEKRFDKVTFFKRIEKSFMFGTPLETLTAIYNCIIFINQLKENNGNKSI